MIIDTNFAGRLEGLLRLYNTSIKKDMYKALCSSEWGLKDPMVKSIEKLQDMQLLSLYMIMLEWKTYEQNTFYLTLDESDCPVINYPSLVAEKDLVDCFIRYMECKHSMNIEPLLKAMGIYPVGVKPDGISYMYINNGPTSCDTNIFEVDKP